MWAAGHADGVAEPDGIATVTLLLAAARGRRRGQSRPNPPMMAAERGHAAIAKLLLAHGADAGLRDKAGKIGARPGRRRRGQAVLAM